MAERDSWATMNGATRIVDAEDTRLAIGALWTPGASAVTARQGIRPGPGTPFKVAATTPTPGANVTVQAGQQLLTATRGFGSYIATLDATKTLPILDIPADPSLQRNDLVIAKQTDTYYADGSTVYAVQRVLGTAGAGDPSLAAFADYMTLARIRIPANAASITNAMIDDLRGPWTVALGGVVPVKDVTDRGTLTQWAGLTIYRLDKGWVEVSDGTAWRVRGLVTVGALADITDPYTGQLVILSTDSMLYRYTGSAWLGVLHTATSGGHARYTQVANQSPVAVGGAWTKTGYPNAVSTHADITQTNPTDYILNRAGTCRITARVRVSTSNVNNIRFLFGIFATADAPTGANPLAVATFIETDATASSTNLHVATGDMRFAAGATISVAVRKDGTAVSGAGNAGGGNNSASEATGGLTNQNSLAFEWVGA